MLETIGDGRAGRAFGMAKGSLWFVNVSANAAPVVDDDIAPETVDRDSSK